MNIRLCVAAVLLLALVACTGEPVRPTFPPPTPTPTASPRPPATPTPTRAATTSPDGSPRPRLFVVVRLTLPGLRIGARQTATAETLTGALCSASVADPIGNETSGLFPKVAGGDGKVTWSWTVGSDNAQGLSKVSVRCILGTDEATGTATFQVFPGAAPSG